MSPPILDNGNKGLRSFSKGTKLKPSHLLSLLVTPCNPTHRFINRLLCRQHSTNATLNQSCQNEVLHGSQVSFLSTSSNWKLRRIWIWYSFEPYLWMPPPHSIPLQFWNLGPPCIISPNQATSLPCNPLKGLYPYPSHLQQPIYVIRNSKTSENQVTKLQQHVTDVAWSKRTQLKEEPMASTSRSSLAKSAIR